MERKTADQYPQELLNLFDKYVHGDIDRRGFLEGAQRFATGTLTAAAILESLRPNYAWAQQVPKDDSRIKTEWDTVPSPQGNGSIKGYLVKPANAAAATRTSLSPLAVPARAAWMTAARAAGGTTAATRTPAPEATAEASRWTAPAGAGKQVSCRRRS